MDARAQASAEREAELHAEIERLQQVLAEERTRAESALDFIERGSIALHRVGPDGTILWANQAELDLLGYPSDEYIGRNIVEFHASRAAIDDILERLARGEVLCNYEAQLRCKSGDIRTVLINSSVFWRDGEFIHTRCFTRDITDRKRDHLALAESEERYRTLVEQANDAIFLADAESGLIVDANKSAERLLGLPLDQIKGMHQVKLHPPEKLEEYGRLFRDHAKRGGGALERDLFVRHASGRDIPVEISANVIRLNGRPALQGFFRDISERKRAQAELEEKAAELARSNAELELFAATASHDLQEPLRMIASYATLLERRYGEAFDDRGQGYLKHVIGAAERMQNLVKALLGYAQIGQGQVMMEAVTMVTAVREAFENLSDKITACHASVSFDDLPVVRGNRMLLVQLFQNLIGNALKFCEGREPSVRVEGRDAGAEWIFSVSDNGIGIGREDLDRLFKAFQRLHNATRFAGTGLGLATCKKIVDLHGGRMWAESTVGIGSMFFFTLPKGG